MIQVRNLTKSYRVKSGRHFVFRDVNVDFPEGANIGIIGANGSGKSTFLRILGGIDFPDSGKIISDKSFSWPLGLRGGFVNHLSGRDNCRMVCKLYGRDHRETRTVLDKIKELSGIGEYFEEPVKYYSSGMGSRLGFALSMAFDFDYFLIDEITAVGDADFKTLAKKTLEEKAKRSKVIMVSHSMGDIKRFCDVGVYIHTEGIEVYPNIDDAIERYLPKSEASLDGAELIERRMRLEEINLNQVELPKELSESTREIELLLESIEDKLSTPSHRIPGDEADFYSQLARIHLQLGNERKAMEVCRKALDIDPYRFDTQLDLRTIATRRNDVELEDETLAVATRIDAQNVVLLNAKASRLLRKGDHGAARDTAKEAVRIRPKSPAAWNLLAKTQLAMDNIDEALDAQIKAISFSPNNPAFLSQLSLILAQAGALEPSVQARYRAFLCPSQIKDPVKQYKGILTRLRELEESIKV